jgi:8-oxo-dGTP pyrophosphatase MutT (NUDIX family)
MAPSPLPWPRLASEHGDDLMICRVRYDTVTNPRTGASLRRTVLETPGWCNVVALTPERRIVVVRQFRFGTGKVTAEIPGGIVDPGEAHLDAARRELREEAGYTSERWTYLGAVEPNPAFHDNLCHHWLAEEALRTHDQELDGGEDIAVETWDLEELRARIDGGEVRHALVLTALGKVFDLRRAVAK